MNFTLSNPKIKAFFEGTSEHKPIAEFMYVHTHPKTKNFLSEIEVMVHATSVYIQENPKKIGVAHRLMVLAEQYANQISDVNEESAAIMLVALREIYQICFQYLEKSNEDTP